MHDGVATPTPIGSHLLVGLQLSGLAASCYPVDMLNRGAPWWLLFCASGALLGLATLWFNRPGNFSVYPEPKRDARLITDGPYRWLRHPMYSALILMLVGVAGYNGHWLNLAGCVVAAAAVFGKALREERYLHQRFPGYAAFAASRRRFVPYLF